MLKPQDPIRNLNGLTEAIYVALERIGIKYVVQLVTMTSDQVYCIKGIEQDELYAIIVALKNEGAQLSKHPVQMIKEQRPGEIAFGVAVESDCLPSQPLKLSDVKLGIGVNVDTGHVELSVPLGVGLISFRPKNALEVSELIAKKARMLMN